MFSVALSLGSPPAAVNRHRSFKEPGLSSTGFALASVTFRVRLRYIYPAAAVRPAGGDYKGCESEKVKGGKVGAIGDPLEKTVLSGD